MKNAFLMLVAESHYYLTKRSGERSCQKEYVMLIEKLYLSTIFVIINNFQDRLRNTGSIIKNVF